MTSPICTHCGRPQKKPVAWCLTCGQLLTKTRTKTRRSAAKNNRTPEKLQSLILFIASLPIAIPTAVVLHFKDSFKQFVFFQRSGNPQSLLTKIALGLLFAVTTAISIASRINNIESLSRAWQSGRQEELLIVVFLIIFPFFGLICYAFYCLSLPLTAPPLLVEPDSPHEPAEWQSSTGRSIYLTARDLASTSIWNTFIRSFPHSPYIPAARNRKKEVQILRRGRIILSFFAGLLISIVAGSLVASLYSGFVGLVTILWSWPAAVGLMWVRPSSVSAPRFHLWVLEYREQRSKRLQNFLLLFAIYTGAIISIVTISRPTEYEMKVEIADRFSRQIPGPLRQQTHGQYREYEHYYQYIEYRLAELTFHAKNPDFENERRDIPLLRLTHLDPRYKLEIAREQLAVAPEAKRLLWGILLSIERESSDFVFSQGLRCIDDGWKICCLGKIKNSSGREMAAVDLCGHLGHFSGTVRKNNRAFWDAIGDGFEKESEVVLSRIIEAR